MKQIRQSVAFLLDQIEQLKEKQRRLQYEIESLHRSTRQERLGLRGELRDERLQDLTRLIERLERRVPDEDLTKVTADISSLAKAKLDIRVNDDDPC